MHVFHLFVEIGAHLACRMAQSRRRTDKRCLVIQRLAGVCDKDRRDTERVAYEEHRTGGIPRRVTACLEGVAYAAAGKRRSVRFLLVERVAAELLQQHAVLEREESVVLLRRTACERLEPVGEMRGTAVHRPFADADSHAAGYLTMDGTAVVHVVEKLRQYLLVNILFHPLACEHIAGKIIFNLAILCTWCIISLHINLTLFSNF